MLKWTRIRGLQNNILLKYKKIVLKLKDYDFNFFNTNFEPYRANP